MKLACFAIIISCHIFASALAFSQDKPAPTEVSGNIDWVFEIAEGQKISQQTDKPMFIVFRCER